MLAIPWSYNQRNRIKFLIVDSSGIPVTGLGAGYTIQLCKGSSLVFTPGTGDKAEISDGWYDYFGTDVEANTPGPVAIHITGGATGRQELLAVVLSHTTGIIEYTYTLTDIVSGDPIIGANIWITTDVIGNNIIWSGLTDTYGIARDNAGEKPWLYPGVIYVWRQKPGIVFVDPDVETVSNP